MTPEFWSQFLPPFAVVYLTNGHNNHRTLLFQINQMNQSVICNLKQAQSDPSNGIRNINWNEVS